MEKLTIECSDQDIKEVYGNTDVEISLYFNEQDICDGHKTEMGLTKCLCITLEDVEQFADYFGKKLV